MPPLGRRIWLVILGVWVIESLVVFLYPFSPFFWYVTAFLSLSLTVYCIVLNLRPLPQTRQGNRSIQWYTTGNKIIIMQLLLFTLLSFISGVFQFDRFLWVSVFSPLGVYGLVGKGIWIVIKCVLGGMLIVMVVGSARSLYFSQKSSQLIRKVRKRG